MENRIKEQGVPQELTDQQLEKVDGGAQAGNLLFTGKTVKPGNTLYAGERPKAGNLILEEKRSSDKRKTILDKDGIEGILLSGGGRPEIC